MSHDKEYAASGSELIVATDGALECLLWSEVGESGEPLDNDYGVADVAPALRESLSEELQGFIAEYSTDLHGMDYSQIGHDFILTRNGHGAGFWDRGLGARGDRLTAACKPYGSLTAYVGDDGLVYGE